ncbi:hypothetical protein PGT21_032753 [Puccinia graminis f. sp. tritici]|uniref:Uncharacterized protein n=1 Tax=Puccinia graminis f. sp. tritici TaxID=56615 RepID=A0A5B0PL17_PUCGR|nr:hypothetical protein PGT21_032753 [Puccinia graminis f. sp. tritici]
MAEGDRRVSAPRGKHDITRARRSVVPSKWDVLPVAAEGTAPVSAIANSHPSNSDTLPGSDESSDACRKEADNSNRHLLCLDTQTNTKMGTEPRDRMALRSASQRWRQWAQATPQAEWEDWFSFLSRAWSSSTNKGIP